MTSIPAEDDTAIAASQPADLESTHHRVNGVRLHAVTAGKDTDPLVVLLHGFPEFWYAWHRQIEPLVEAGYRVLVPDGRGYNRSEKPESIREYRRETLARDVLELIRADGRDAAHVVGHDWGGIVGWDLAIRHPRAVETFTAINAPHPVAFRRQLTSNPEQLRRSWYAMVFQLPWLPERVCRYDDFRPLERALRGPTAPGTFTDADLERYRQAWRREGALSGMLAWYRASARYPSMLPRTGVDTPTLVAWGRDDAALVSELAIDSYDCCTDARLEFLPDTSHWVPHEEPDRTTALIRERIDG
ncbi:MULTISPECIES: alpha/beta hydrolase [Natrialba]|uniref:Alpha/beta hydrolase n=1 Tax=Natrialba swarupiae TaxID=2448032 RepID=A0A5D5ARW4_9EURY|nr:MULTISPECIES: alpha/beta hydrolase [Natrialba]MWV39663.1 alpha/beta fold hydrolase [Natrialba sp. INN-245]TYT62230.1 alpha/beta hydrolase [Natrialba swarupiae]